MTPKEKAIELVGRFTVKVKCKVTPKISVPITLRREQAKQCALICVDEILESLPIDVNNDGTLIVSAEKREYWQEVKEELIKLNRIYESNRTKNR